MNPSVRNMTHIVAARDAAGVTVLREIFSALPQYPVSLIFPMDAAYQRARELRDAARDGTAEVDGISYVTVFCRDFPGTGETYYVNI